MQIIPLPKRVSKNLVEDLRDALARAEAGEYQGGVVVMQRADLSHDYIVSGIFDAYHLLGMLARAMYVVNISQDNRSKELPDEPTDPTRPTDGGAA